VKKPSINISFGFYKMQGFLITIALLLTKVLGFYDIPWIWVFAPYWLPLVLFFAMLIAIGLCLAVAFLIALALDK
jgi:hypothetical protein